MEFKKMRTRANLAISMLAVAFMGFIGWRRKRKTEANEGTVT